MLTIMFFVVLECFGDPRGVFSYLIKYSGNEELIGDYIKKARGQLHGWKTQRKTDPGGISLNFN